ncbi:transferrin-binding protein-like solute binding protein [Xenorhabdus sp. XENO-10]|uniref:Transferrin-binding protein-like solute binding protein n=1 Tax=Xenorhabdus yunnanensis TaxID=3025878 RepID=A0ABT5LCG4_9GAMM|nr:Slam-dependent surface lipoprotein [Xenorhabdus yunnanensis]MDC9588650.1 transferrin-binding protein-like solute binding protein [Xenorhabdus yunnanensis]
MMKTIKVLVAALGTLGFMAQAQAAVGFGQSQKETTPHITVGATKAGSNSHEGADGEPGIGVSSIGEGKLIGFAGLTRMAQADSNGIHNISRAGAPGSHGGMGVFHFSKVANADIYFGEWSETGKASDSTHTVYYAGKDITTNIPTDGTATYTITGINQYSGDNTLSGTFTADFGEKTLIGSMANTAMTIDIDANIGSDAKFEGIAATDDLIGTTTGHFFGDSASSLAGYTTFSDDRSKDTAFGGSKQ